MVATLRFLVKKLSVVNYMNATAGKNVAAVLLAAMTLMIISQVFFRYILNDSLAWTEELAKFAMVWMACLVAPWAYIKHLNVAIDMFHQALPIYMQRAAEIAITLLVLIVSYQFLMYSLNFVSGGRSITAASVNIPLFYIYLCIPYLFGSLLLIAFEKLLTQLTTPVDITNNNKESA
jgi:TRAP-type C4-dicarboxylate transport system permease small subunit